MKISIFGCGWLGLPLGQRLVNNGYSVKGSTTSSQKIHKIEQAGIEPYLIHLPDDLQKVEKSPFLNSDILFLNIPPGRGNSDVTTDYPQLIEKISDVVQKSDISWVIFISSTSVFGNQAGLVFEDDAVPGVASRPSGEALLKCESLLERYPFSSTIIRFGGLYGYDRHPVHYLAGRKNLKNASAPVNLIHQDDCISIINKIIKLQVKDTIFNAVSDGHPPKKEFYESAAIHFGLEPPRFENSNNAQAIQNRIISNKKLKEELDYTFIYPNPLDHTP